LYTEAELHEEHENEVEQDEERCLAQLRALIAEGFVVIQKKLGEKPKVEKLSLIEKRKLVLRGLVNKHEIQTVSHSILFHHIIIQLQM